MKLRTLKRFAIATFVSALVIAYAGIMLGRSYLDNLKRDPRCQPWCQATISIVQKVPEFVRHVAEAKAHHHTSAPKTAP